MFDKLKEKAAQLFGDDNATLIVETAKSGVEQAKQDKYEIGLKLRQELRKGTK